MSFTHTMHDYLVFIAKFLTIIAVLAFIPIPLFSFFGGDMLHYQDHNPIFDYFNHYQISNQQILDNDFTNVYISKDNKNIEQHDIDNAILWADFLAYELNEENIPVVRKIVGDQKVSKSSSSLKSLQIEAAFHKSNSFQFGEKLLEFKQQFQDLLPIDSITEGVRQWIILALSAKEQQVKKQLKRLLKKYPNDNFLVLSQTPMTINKKSLNIKLPDFNIKQAKKSLSEGLRISPIQAEILLIHFNKSLWHLNHANLHGQYSIKSILGDHYYPLGQISKKSLTILQKLCANQKLDAPTKSLQEWGVVVKKGQYIWKNQIAELNFQLFSQKLCGKNFIDRQQKK